MRDVKFRAWIKKSKRMEHCIDVNPFHIGDCDRLYWKHDEVELMQYTGLKDKNGKEIYEGDIVFADSHGSLSSLTPNGENIIGEVYFTEGCFCIGCSENISRSLIPLCIYEISILGNIYENPELLKGE